MSVARTYERTLCAPTRMRSSTAPPSALPSQCGEDFIKRLFDVSIIWRTETGWAVPSVEVALGR